MLELWQTVSYRRDCVINCQSKTEKRVLKLVVKYVSQSCNKFRLLLQTVQTGRVDG